MNELLRLEHIQKIYGNGGYWDNEEVNEGAENQRDPEQSVSSGRDWGKGFKPADDEHV